ncbi:MAG TPA: tetratricopeptide repeat protein [Stellaceae bacterium]|nr:tetratricopeptide repeat protein [Stellaceae bacterium]
MASSSAADAMLAGPVAGPGEAPLSADAARPAASSVDRGEPVENLPPLVEIGFDPPPGAPAVAAPVAGAAAPPATSRPPRRSFLAGRRAPAAAAPAPADGAAEPMMIEPVAETASPAAPRFVARVAAMLRAWLPATLPARRLDRRQRLVLIAAAVLILIGAVADILGLGPFARGGYRLSGPPPSNPADRVAYYQKGADAGDPDAQLQLAILYAKGEGVAQSYATAASWFRAAANQGVARAQYDLGVLYERGRGVTADQTEAASWYLKAAEGKYPLAQYNLAVCYTKGQGTRKDLPEAALWYRRAAVQGVVQAMINLATMYENGDGLRASPVDAYAWYLAAGRRDSQGAARRAQDLFGALSHLDQIRAQALASDVEGSIHDPQPSGGETAMRSTDAKPATPDR